MISAGNRFRRLLRDYKEKNLSLQLTNKPNMKRLLPLLSALVLITGMVFIPDSTFLAAAQDPDIEQISIETQNDPGGERGLPGLVEAYFLHATNTLYITLASSLGNVSITVTNAAGIQVYSSVVDATLAGFVQFAAPIVPGTYSLEIQSANYYGSGSFTI